MVVVVVVGRFEVVVVGRLEVVAPMMLTTGGISARFR